MALYAWREPGWVFLLAMLAALPFVLAAAFSPALLSLAPTVDMIGPIADARAIADGASSLSEDEAPFYAALLLAGDLFAETPGRVHLLAKGFAAMLAAYPLAYLCSARFPALATVLITAAVAAYAAAPFSGPAEIGLSFFIVAAMALICAPADESRGRARFEGGLAGAALAVLWGLSPVFAFAGFAALAACPFLTGRAGLQRYAAAVIVLAGFAALLELLAPGFNIARAEAASTLFQGAGSFGGEGAAALGGVAACAAAAIFAAAVFGGGEHARGWAAGAGLIVVAFVAARISGANATPIFVIGAALAVFSVASPFYDGVFRAHDRASVAIGAVAASLTLFWAVSMIVHATGQFALQYRVAAAAPADIRAAFGLVQPGGSNIARWIEEGRFSTPEARELFALAPVDQSAMLLEAAGRARQFSSYGVDVAILTDADAACVIGGKRACRAGGAEAAEGAKVVFVPRLDLDPATSAAKGRSEALLYTEFRLIEQTPLWDIWVRRGAHLPAEITLNAPLLTNR